MKAGIQQFSKTFSRPVIINLVFPSLLLLFSFKTGTGTAREKLPEIRSVVKVAGAFQKVHIDGNLSIVLTNEPWGTLIIEGRKRDVNKIKYRVKNGELFIDAQQKNSFAGLTIYLSAATLRSIHVNGDADIFSVDVVHVNDLRVSLNGYASVKVKTIGRLIVDTPVDYELFRISSMIEK